MMKELVAAFLVLVLLFGCVGQKEAGVSAGPGKTSGNRGLVDDSLLPSASDLENPVTSDDLPSPEGY